MVYNKVKKKYRAKALDMKGEYCHICGKKDSIEVHHIDADRDNNHIRNLLPVCQSCHQDIHSGNLGLWSKYVKRSLTPDSTSTENTVATGEFDTKSELVAATEAHQEGKRDAFRDKGITFHSDNIPSHFEALECPVCGSHRIVKEASIFADLSYGVELECKECSWEYRDSHSIDS